MDVQKHKLATQGICVRFYRWYCRQVGNGKGSRVRELFEDGGTTGGQPSTVLSCVIDCVGY